MNELVKSVLNSVDELFGKNIFFKIHYYFYNSICMLLNIIKNVLTKNYCWAKNK